MTLHLPQLQTKVITITKVKKPPASAIKCDKFGRKSFKSDEHAKLTHVGSNITSGGDLGIISGDEQRYQAAKLNSGADLTLDSGVGIVFEGVKDLEQKSRIRSKSNWAWQSAKGKGNTDETLMQSQLQAQGEIAIRAAEKIQIDIKEIRQQSVSQTIDAMVRAEPQLAWLKDMERRGDIDWRQVKELHDSFKYSHSGLGGPAAIGIAIVVASFTGGAISSFIGSTAGTTAGSGTAMATGTAATATTAATSAGWANVALTAVMTSAISTINNKGNLSSVVKDVTSSNALKGYATSAAIAGLGNYAESWGRELTVEGNYKLVSGSKRFGAYLANTALKGLLTGDDDAKAWLTIAGTGALMELYQYSVGREPDAREGVGRPYGTVYDESLGYVPRVLIDGKWREGKNIDLNLSLTDPRCSKIYAICHGTPIINILNKIPGFNSFATLHDQWMNSLELNTGR